MREPAFWWRPSSVMSGLLAPVAAVYGAIADSRMQRKGAQAGIPVICVGNFHMGGAGKTPTVLALVEILKATGEFPVVLSRGYGGRLKGPLQVDASMHAAEDVGDEPLLLSRVVPVIVSPDRILGARTAREAGASVIVMDDGFQNPSLHKDFSLIVIDGRRGIGNGHVFPAGPLRAPLATQIARTDALIVVGEGAPGDDIATKVAGLGCPVLRVRLAADAETAADLVDKPVLAFAGIGDPDRFFATLKANGIVVAATRIFPDHHPFNHREIAEILAEAQRLSLIPVTTEKDFVRVRGVVGIDVAAIRSFPVTLVVQDERAFRDLIRTHLAAARAS